MSAFLGPIHHWLYNKIQLQESLTQAILSCAETDNSKVELQSRLNTDCGMAENKELGEVIDTDNIHGWLQGQITIVEKRFAMAVTLILDADASQINNLLKAAEKTGEKHKISSELNAEKIYQTLNDILLEGMPCDRVNQVLEQSPQKIIWQQTVDLHLPFWEQAGGDIKNYYLLRNAFISGLLQDTGFVFKQDKNQFSILEG